MVLNDPRFLSTPVAGTVPAPLADPSVPTVGGAGEEVSDIGRSGPEEVPQGPDTGPRHAVLATEPDGPDRGRSEPGGTGFQHEGTMVHGVAPFPADPKRGLLHS